MDSAILGKMGKRFSLPDEVQDEIGHALYQAQKGEKRRPNLLKDFEVLQSWKL